MLLGLFKRVALWQEKREIERFKRRIDELLEADVSDPALPLAIATFWRDVGVSVFTDIPMDKQICLFLNRNHESFQEAADLLSKSLRLILEDDYEHLTQYLSRRLEKKYSDPVAVYLTDKKGIPIDTEAAYLRVATELYSMAAVLDGMASFEYHRAVNLLYKELVVVIAQLLEIKRQ